MLRVRDSGVGIAPSCCRTSSIFVQGERPRPLAGRARHRPDARAPAGRAARRHGRGGERGPGRQRVHAAPARRRSAAARPPAGAAAVARRRRAARRVLVVDDNADAAEMLCACCSSCAGHEVETADDGAGGARRPRSAPPRWCCSTSACPAWTATRSRAELRGRPGLRRRPARRGHRLRPARGPPPRPRGGLRRAPSQAGRGGAPVRAARRSADLRSAVAGSWSGDSSSGARMVVRPEVGRLRTRGPRSANSPGRASSSPARR